MPDSTVGIVIIGRNEGDRLSKCLASVLPTAQAAMYVDSGSTDGSVEMAQTMGANVLPLDLGSPLTAARARNAGYERLLSLHPKIRFVMFVDGDCEVVDGWMHDARDYLEASPECAAVCGRRRERHPERSVYKKLCDIEWAAPLGDALSCGGDALFRTKAFTQVSGFRDGLIAGEEPELCLRLRGAGWHIHRLALVFRSIKTNTYQVTPRSNLFQRNTTGDALISAMPLRMRCFRSSLDVTRMCRKKVRAILEKAHSIKLSQEPCLGV